MELTNGETIHIVRRRASMSQKELADKHEVSQPAISKWETGKTNAEAIAPLDPPLADCERAHILRRRLRWTIKSVARRMSLSHVTILRMEAGERDCGALLKYLENEIWEN
jgi:transcriptional regulator with XRE-family HTH domain